MTHLPLASRADQLVGSMIDSSISMGLNRLPTPVMSGPSPMSAS